jgi:hypothetical protein
VSCICGNQPCPKAESKWCVSEFLLYRFIIPLYVFSQTCIEDSWSDLKDDAENTLHIGKQEYKTKYGKKADSFFVACLPKGCQFGPCLVVTLILEQTKVTNEESNIHNSLMKLIKTSAINKAPHANSFGKRSVFSMQITWIHVLHEFIYYMNLFNT